MPGAITNGHRLVYSTGDRDRTATPEIGYVQGPGGATGHPGPGVNDRVQMFLKTASGESGSITNFLDADVWVAWYEMPDGFVLDRHAEFSSPGVTNSPTCSLVVAPNSIVIGHAIAGDGDNTRSWSTPTGWTQLTPATFNNAADGHPNNCCCYIYSALGGNITFDPVVTNPGTTDGAAIQMLSFVGPTSLAFHGEPGGGVW